MANRKAAEQFFLENLRKSGVSKKNYEYYQNKFSKMSDKEFDVLMDKVKEGYILPVFMPVDGDEVPSIKKWFKLCDQLNLVTHQQLEMTDPVSGVRRITPHKYAVLRMMVRRQKQHLVKGKSVASHDKQIDQMTGQVTGDSKSSRLSLPEITILEAAGRTRAIDEFIKVRGGDIKAYREAKRRMIEQGSYSLDSINELGTRAVSIDTMRSLLLGMHYDNNI